MIDTIREEKRKAKNKATRKWLGNNQEYRLLHSAKQRAKREGMVFRLGYSDIKIPSHCPYLGMPITNIMGQGNYFSNASIDRIDSNLGYTPDNIQIISILANQMKSNATEEQLIVFAQNVLRRYKRDVIPRGISLCEGRGI